MEQLWCERLMIWSGNLLIWSNLFSDPVILNSQNKPHDMLSFSLKGGVFSISAKVSLAYFLSEPNFTNTSRRGKFALISTTVLFRSHVNNLLMSQMLFRADPAETPFVLVRYWDGALEIPLVPSQRFPLGAWGICPALATSSQKHNGAPVLQSLQWISAPSGTTRYAKEGKIKDGYTETTVLRLKQEV